MVQTPIIPVVEQWIKKNPGTISLGQGMVHYGPPPLALERMNQALQDPKIHQYGPGAGTAELLDLVGQKLKKENQIILSCESQIVVTAGANMAFMYALLAITNPGDEIILQSPYYFNHEMAITMASCKTVLIPTDSQYQLQTEKIREAITDRTRAVVTVSPNNPTGAVYPEESLREVNQICQDANIYHISDEVYEYFNYDGAVHFSPGSLEGAGESTISLFSLSKAYGFAGWRIGYMTAPQHLLGAIRKIQDTILICPTLVSQYAAIGALEVGAGYCKEHLKSLAEVRDLVFEALGLLGERVRIPKTQGAFYAFIKVENVKDPVELARQLIENFQVAAVPGSAFGLEKGAYLRVSYGALKRDTVAEGIGRLVKGLRQLTDI
ncbi:MAG: pyridoxal phosphate-dependent aminotransferase [SAR324 cluster bacterium]|nr:pyridoxal phosphate-dependent aminotransferase [SAR324 cluster bacterium]